LGRDRESQTCLICRLSRVDTTCSVIPIARYRENECSRWYPASVEPQHKHIWERGTCVYKSNLMGRSLSVGCSPGHCPIWLLSPATQLAV
jgi:hypothetical protein